MTVMVPYRSTGARRAMINRAMTSVGTRAHGGGMLIADPRRTIQPVGISRAALSGLGCGCGPVGYEAAKRQNLGALGDGLTTVKQGYTGVTTGAAAAGITTAIGTSIAGAIGAGAAAGSVVPIIGTAIGAIVGLLASGILNHKADPEVANFNQAMALYKQSPASVVNIANKYLVLAGLFDLQPGQIKGNIPIYKKYGRMGEQRFVTDMMTQVLNAAQNGTITNSDTPLTVMQKVVQPWIDSFGFGPMTDSNADMITLVLIGMIADYVTGNQHVWYAVGGQFAFPNLPAFSLPQPKALPAPPVYVAPPVMSTAAPLPPVYVAPLCTAPLLWNGTQCVPPAAAPVPPPSALNCAAPYVWNGTQCVLPNNAIPPSPPPAATAPPTNYSPVGTDSSGNTIYASAQGVLYSWTGTGMQIFAGQLATGNTAAAQMQAALQNSLAQGQSAQQAAAAALQQAQNAGVALTPQLQQQVASQVQATQAAPVQPVTAGTGGGLGTTAQVVSIAAAVLGLMFATARPAKQPTTRAPRKSRRRA